MDKINKTIKDIEEELKEKVKVIEEKTGKTISFQLGFNESVLRINKKKITFIMIGALRNYVDGMYEVVKDL